MRASTVARCSFAACSNRSFSSGFNSRAVWSLLRRWKISSSSAAPCICTHAAAGDRYESKEASRPNEKLRGLGTSAASARALGPVLGVNGGLKEHLLSARPEHLLHRRQSLDLLTRLQVPSYSESVWSTLAHSRAALRWALGRELKP